MKKTAIIIITVLFALATSWALADDVRKKRILYVNSYHQGYQWSDDITQGVKLVLDGREDVELKITYMDTKRNMSEGFKKAAALEVKSLIASWKPDVVIASDDNASKYLIAPYYKGADLPFVFCGLNWDASVYGFPASNVTGMVEVSLYRSVIDTLGKFAKGGRIGYLASDTVTVRKELKNTVKLFNADFKIHLVKTFDELKQAFLNLQKEADMVVMLEFESVKDFDRSEMIEFVKTNISVPTGAIQRDLVHYAMMTFSKSGEEQGEYAARTALEILAGKSPEDIPVVTNKKSKTYLNMILAKRLGVKFPMELIENADLISAEQKKVLFINSYHKGYEWSDDIEKGFMKALYILENPDGTYDTYGSDIELKVFRMDTKLNKSEAFKKQVALKAKAIIDEWQPDIVVASDDNASKYLIAPYYKNAATPFVFCGLNWDASVYGFPVSNVTGMVEIDPVLQTIEILKEYAKGDRIGFIGVKSISAQKSVDTYVERLGINLSGGKLVSDFSEWKQEYLRLQDSVDMILWFNPVGITGWDSKLAEKFILENTKIPTGATADNNKRFALVGIVKIAEEQGWWAGKRALEILDGKSPEDIPVTTNKESRVYLNMELAKRLGIKFSMELIEKATFLETP
jgi:ABC-type uncharacterized transport system substrate-binding protein